MLEEYQALTDAKAKAVEEMRRLAAELDAARDVADRPSRDGRSQGRGVPAVTGSPEWRR